MTDTEPDARSSHHRLIADGGYPWNVEIDVEGVTFHGPGMADEGSAMAIANLVADAESVDRAEVVKR